VLKAYPWPGNVRELENALEYAVALCTGQTIQIEDLPEEIRAGGATAPPPRPADPAPEPAGRAGAADPERERIVEVLEAARWNRRKAADSLGLSRSTLWRRMRDLGIE
jgi:transcriptional regulator of acetoin/glycerol metabolism